MRRREFIAGLGAAMLSNPGRAVERPAKGVRIGMCASVPRSSPGWVAFERRLGELGYREGADLTSAFVELGADKDAYFSAVAELAPKSDVLVVGGPEIALRAAAQATRTAPIVVVAIDFDPVTHGYVESLARPGRNITGVILRQPELSGKRVELLKEALPNLTRAVLLWDDISADQVGPARAVAASLGLRITDVKLRDPPYDFAGALAEAGGQPGTSVLASASPFIFRDRDILARLALGRQLALMSPFRELTEAGALASYGVSLSAMYERAAEFVDRIVKGARPSDLPAELPTKFELVVNLKTAKALGIEIPPSLLARADDVIE